MVLGVAGQDPHQRARRNGEIAGNTRACNRLRIERLDQRQRSAADGDHLGGHILDVACGTGLVAVEAARILGSAENITCLDPSAGMLAVARKKIPATFVQGRAEALPFPDGSFDFLTMGYALRHVMDLETTFREYHRVLRPGGTVLILEVTKPSSAFGNFFFRLYFGRIYPALTQLFTRSRDAREMMAYYWETMDACVPPAEVLAAMRAAGFAKVKRKHMGGLFSEYSAVRTQGLR